MTQPTEVDVRPYHFKLFLYSSQPWGEERTAVGALITDGATVATIVRRTYIHLPSACHFAKCVSKAAERSLNGAHTSARRLLERVAGEAIDKGTSMGFGHLKCISAINLEQAKARVAQCYLDEDAFVVPSDLPCS